MSISWGNWDVRVYAAEAWVSLAPRFAADNPIIVDKIEEILADPVSAVRLQAAQNLQVICLAAPARMWAIGERIAALETDPEILCSYLNQSMSRFSHAEPERCEAVLAIVKSRFEAGFGCGHQGRDILQEALGGWIAQLGVGQGRPLVHSWLEQYAADPHRYSPLLDAYMTSLRKAFFKRYAAEAGAEDKAMCDRAQRGLSLILAPATAISSEAHAVLVTNLAEEERKVTLERYSSAEKVIHHAMNQIYFGAGADARSVERGKNPGLPDAAAQMRFLADYSTILSLLAGAREPGTLHRLIELYEILIPGDPVAVFDALHAILCGRGEEEGYHHESLGNAAVVRIIRRYLSDHRALFEDEDRRDRLVAILRLFSEVGWTDALKLLYDLPDLLR